MSRLSIIYTIYFSRLSSCFFPCLPLTLPLFPYTQLFIFNYLRLLKLAMLFYVCFFFFCFSSWKAFIFCHDTNSNSYPHLFSTSVQVFLMWTSHPQLFQERTEYSFLGVHTDFYNRTHKFYCIYLLKIRLLNYRFLGSRNLFLFINVSLVTSMISTLQAPEKFLIKDE